MRLLAAYLVAVTKYSIKAMSGKNALFWSQFVSTVPHGREGMAASCEAAGHTPKRRDTDAGARQLPSSSLFPLRPRPRRAPTTAGRVFPPQLDRPRGFSLVSQSSASEVVLDPVKLAISIHCHTEGVKMSENACPVSSSMVR